MTKTDAATASWVGPKSDKTFLGHPVGLFVLFFTEMWERFSYYGMRGLLKLYMVNYLFTGVRQVMQGDWANRAVGSPDAVMGWTFIRSLLPAVAPDKLQRCIDGMLPTLAGKGVLAEEALRIATGTCQVQPQASVLYGWYTGLVYLTPVLGGYLADKYLGQKRAVFIGGALMAIGQFMLFGLEDAFFFGLLVLIIGNGLFKPNISTQVGNLYPPGDTRRDGAFTIFYMGINLGAFLCSFVCGTLAAVYGWKYGFLSAGIGMLIGLTVQVFGQSYLSPDTLQARVAEGGKPAPAQKESDEGPRIMALVVLCLLNVVFWAVYEQQGNTMQSWADDRTVWPVVLGFQIPSTWFQSFNPFFVFMMAPFLDRFWASQAKSGKEPSSVTKMAIGSVILGLSFIVMVAGAKMIGDGKGSLFWPVACTLLLTVGELYLSPIGLSLVTKVSPVRLVSMMMGMWFLSSFLGNILSGYIGVLYSRWTPEAFFMLLMALGLGTGAAMWAFNKPLRAAMGGKH